MEFLKRLIGKLPATGEDSAKSTAPASTFAMLIVGATTKIPPQDFNAVFKPIFTQLYRDYPGMELVMTATTAPKVLIDANDREHVTLMFPIRHPDAISTVAIQAALTSLLNEAGFDC